MNRLCYLPVTRHSLLTKKFLGFFYRKLLGRVFEKVKFIFHVILRISMALGATGHGL
jgi:hypothetical protein